MYDIIFLSYQEPNKEENWEALLAEYPWAMRVDGVKGIFEAHKAAAELSDTKYFFVVDADNIVNPDFEFDHQWDEYDRVDDRVAVWRSVNSVNGLVYGYGGIKLLPKRRIIEMEGPVVDFTTTISKRFHVMPEIASTTVINPDAFTAWRSGFRECVKLSSKVIRGQHNDETEQRLETWVNTGSEKPFGQDCINGARDGKVYGSTFRNDPEALAKVNDYEWLKETYDARLLKSKCLKSD